jgi:hypothetical protein
MEMARPPAGLDARRLQSSREELVERIARVMHSDGVIEPLQGLHLGRSSVPLDELHGVLEPSFCVIAQGSKEVLLGSTAIAMIRSIISCHNRPAQCAAGGRGIQRTALSQPAAELPPSSRLGHGRGGLRLWEPR